MFRIIVKLSLQENFNRFARIKANKTIKITENLFPALYLQQSVPWGIIRRKDLVGSGSSESDTLAFDERILYD